MKEALGVVVTIVAAVAMLFASYGCGGGHGRPMIELEKRVHSSSHGPLILIGVVILLVFAALWLTS